MAGMAVSVGYMLAQEQKGHKISMTYWQGHEEDSFLRSMGTELADLEPKANNCRDVLVWHTKTKKVQVPLLNFRRRLKDHIDNLASGLIENMKQEGMVAVDTEKGLEVLACFQSEGCQ